jgi:hypothetical protein
MVSSAAIVGVAKTIVSKGEAGALRLTAGATVVARGPWFETRALTAALLTMRKSV